MGVKLLDVQGSSTVVHIDSVADWALNLNCLSTVSLLRVQLATVAHARDWVNEHHRVFVVGATIGSADDSLACRVVAEVCLVHKLFVKRRVDGAVVV